MTTLANIVYDIFDGLGEIRSGIATGGTTTTVVDTGLKPYSTDEFKYGTVLIEWDAGDAGAAPEGEYREISGFTASSGTVTVGTAFSAAPAAGDRYALMGGDFRLDDVLRKINQTLRRMGKVLLLDSSITTSSGKTEHALPTGVNPQDIRRIWIDTYTSDSDDSVPVELLDWRVVPEDTYPLKFRTQPQTGRTLYIQYMGVHPDIWASTDTLKTTVDRNRIVAEVIYQLLKEKIRKDRDTSDIAIQILNDAREDMMEARKKHPLMDPGKPHKPILTRSGVDRRAKYGPWLVE